MAASTFPLIPEAVCEIQSTKGNAGLEVFNRTTSLPKVFLNSLMETISS